MDVSQVTEGIYKLSSAADSRILFESMWPIPHGVTMNSYLVKGEKWALIDGVCGWEGVPEVLFNQLSEMGLNINDLEYVVINHMEPDHTGWLEALREIKADFTIVGTKKALEFLNELYSIDTPKLEVKSGDSVDLGQNKILEFHEIPHVHWPETMATLEKSSGTIMTCDAFGSFGYREGLEYDDDLSDDDLTFFHKEGLRYYSNIIARFSNSVKKAIKKIVPLHVQIIAPAHGIVWRRDPTKIIRFYEDFADYACGVAKAKITLIWSSMYGNTQKAVLVAEEALKSAAIDYQSLQIPQTHLSYVLQSVWESTGIILAMPTYEYGMFPPMADVIHELAKKKVVKRQVFRFGSYGWSGGAQRELEELNQRHKMNWYFIEAHEFKGAPDSSDLEKIKNSTLELVDKVKTLTTPL